MKYILDSKSKKFAIMRKNVVRFLLTSLAAIMNCGISFAATEVYPVWKDLSEINNYTFEKNKEQYPQADLIGVKGGDDVSLKYSFEKNFYHYDETGTCVEDGYKSVDKCIDAGIYKVTLSLIGENKDDYELVANPAPKSYSYGLLSQRFQIRPIVLDASDESNGLTPPTLITAEDRVYYDGTYQNLCKTKASSSKYEGWWKIYVYSKKVLDHKIEKDENGDFYPLGKIASDKYSVYYLFESNDGNYITSATGTYIGDAVILPKIVSVKPDNENMEYTYDGGIHPTFSMFNRFIKSDEEAGLVDLDIDGSTINPGENQKVTLKIVAGEKGDASANYTFSDGNKTLELKFSIHKKSPYISSDSNPSSVSSVWYDGKPHLPIKAGTTSEDNTPGEWKYYTINTSDFTSLEDIFSDYSKFTETPEELVEVGEYRTYMIYVPTNTDIYKVYEYNQNSFSFSIKKINLNSFKSSPATILSPNPIPYDGEDHDPIIVASDPDTKNGEPAGHWEYYTAFNSNTVDKTAFSENVTKVKAVGKYRTFYKFVPDDSNIEEFYDGNGLDFEITAPAEKIVPGVTAPTAISKFLQFKCGGGALVNAGNKNGIEGDYWYAIGDNELKPTNVRWNDAGSYTVRSKFVPTDQVMYKDTVFAPITVEVQQMTVDVKFSGTEHNYDEHSASPTAELVNPDDQCSTDVLPLEIGVKCMKDGEEQPMPSEIGTYEIEAYITSIHKNYKLAKNKSTLTIKKRLSYNDWFPTGTKTPYTGKPVDLLNELGQMEWKSNPSDDKGVPVDVVWYYVVDTKPRSVKESDFTAIDDDHKPQATEIGKYYIYLKFVPVDKDTYYSGTQLSIGAEITEPKEITNLVMPKAVTGLTYTGGPQTLNTKGSSKDVEGTFKLYFAGNEDDVYTDVIKGTDAKGYTIVAKFVPDDKTSYSEVVDTIKDANIAKAEVEIEWGTLELPCTGTAQVPTATVSEGIQGTDKVKVNVTDPDGALKYPSSTAHTAIASSLTNSNYKISSSSTTEVKYNIVGKDINKILTITPNTRIYDETEKALVIVAYESTDGILTYKTTKDGVYGKDIPVATEIDKYTVYYKFEPTDGCYSTVTGEIPVEILANPVSFDENPKLVYNGALQTLMKKPKIVEGVSGDLYYAIKEEANSDEPVYGEKGVLPSAKYANEKILLYVKFVTEDEKYAKSSPIILSTSTSIEKATVIVEFAEDFKKPAAGEKISSDSYELYVVTKSGKTPIYDKDVTVDLDWKVDSEDPTKFKVTASNISNKNYKLADTVYVFSETETPLTPLSLTLKRDDWTYGDTPSETSLTGNVCDGKTLTPTYTFYTDKDCTTKTTKTANGAANVGGEPTYAGTYYVVANVAPTDQCEGASDTTSFTINKKTEYRSTDIHVPGQLEIYYDGTEQKLLSKGEPAGVDGYFEYLQLDGTYKKDVIPTAKDVNTKTKDSTYVLASYFIPADNVNYEKKGFVHVSKIKPAEIIVEFPNGVKKPAEGETFTADYVLKVVVEISKTKKDTVDIYDNDVTVDLTYAEDTKDPTKFTVTATLPAKFSNYKLIKDKYEFTEAAIEPQEWSFTITMDGWKYGESPNTPSIEPNPTGVTPKYTYYTDAACTIATSEAHGADVTAGRPTLPGTYYVKAIVEATSDYALATNKKSFEISKRDIKPLCQPTPTTGNTVATFIYNGEPQVPTVKLRKKIDTDDVDYSMSGAQTNASEESYTATFILTGTNADRYYIEEGFDQCYFKITKREVGVVWDNTTLVYKANEEQAPTATLTNKAPGFESGIDVKVEGKKTEVSEPGTTYTATAVLVGADKANYAFAANTETSVEFTISKSIATDFTKPTALTDLTYTGLKQTLIVPGEQGITEGSFQYYVDNVACDGLPKAQTGGEYVVGYKFIPEDPNIMETAIASFIVTIAPAESEIEWDTDTLTYNGQSQAPKAKLKSPKDDDVVTLDVDGEKTLVGSDYTATASLKEIDAKNYKIIGSATQTFKIGQSDATDFTAPIAQTVLTYNGVGQNLIKELGKQGNILGKFKYALGEDGVYEEDYMPVGKTPDTYTIGYMFVPTDPGYKTTGPITTTVKIQQKLLTIEWGPNKDLVYNGNPQLPEYQLTGVEGNDKVDVSVSGSKTAVNNGYLATAELIGTDKDNYYLSTGNKSFEFNIISKKVARPVFGQTEFTYEEGVTYTFVNEVDGYSITGKASASEPGTYVVKVSPSIGTTWNDGESDTMEETFVIKKIVVDAPAKDTRTFYYNGQAQTYSLVKNDAYTIKGNVQSQATTHTVTVDLVDKDHYEWSDNHKTDSKTYTFEILKSTVKLPTVDSVSVYTYDGVEKNFNITVSAGSTLNDSNAVGTDAGKYVRTIILNNGENPEEIGYEWNNHTTDTISFTFEIKPQKVIVPVVIEKQFIYNGKPFTFKVPEDTAFVKRYVVDMETTQEIGPGKYKAYARLIDKKNYVWDDDENPTNDIEIEFEIGDGTIDVPVVKPSYTYTGDSISFVPVSSAYTVKIEGGNSTDVGTYKLTITPNTNYKWKDGTITPEEITTKIVEKPIAIPAFNTLTVTYDGEDHFEIPTSEYYEITGDELPAIMPGKYSATLKLNSSNYMWEDGTKSDMVYNFEITKIKVTIPGKPDIVYTYNGKEQTFQIEENPVYRVVNNKQTDAGTYAVYVIMDSPYHMWDGHASDTVSYRFLIGKQKVVSPTAPQKVFDYDGTPKNFEITENENYIIDEENATATNVGTYERTVSLVDPLNYMWKDSTIAPIKITFEIKSSGVVVPTVDLVRQYTGSPITFVKSSDAYVATNGVLTDAGKYTITVSLNPGYIWLDGTSVDKTFDVEITPLYVSQPNVIEAEYEYDGSTHSFGFKPNDGYSFVGDTAAKEPGVYTVIVKLNKNYIWDDDTEADLDFTFSITKLEVAIPLANTTKFTYNGEAQTYSVVIPEDSLFVISDNIQTKADTYNVKLSLKDPLHYTWADSTSDDLLYEFVINKFKVQLPTAPTVNFKFDGKAQELVVNPSEYYVVDEANSTATKKGTYVRTVSLKDKENYIWVDETTEDKEITFIMGDGLLPIPNVTLEYTYTGEPIVFVPEDGAYTVANGTKTDVGKYKVVVVPNDGYRWDDGTDDGTQPLIYNVVIRPIIVEKPVLTLDYTYSGKIIDFKVPVNAAYVIAGETSAKELGQYKVTIDLLPNYMWNDSTTGLVTYIFSINKKIVPIPPVVDSVYVYNGKRQTYPIAKSNDYSVVANSNVQTYAGSYEVSVLLTDLLHSMWSDSTIALKTYKFDIQRAKVELPTAVQESFTYDGATKYFDVVENSRYEVLAKNASASKVGAYERTVRLKDTLNYTWIDNTVTDKTVMFVIGNGIIDFPTVITDTLYTGSPITLVPENNAYVVTNGTQVNANTYNVTVKLKEGYLWSNKTTKDTTYTCVIRPIQVEKPVFPTTSVYTYNDTIHGVVIPASDAYLVDGITQTKEPGVYEVVVSLNPNYVWKDDNTYDPLKYVYTINKIMIEIPAAVDSVFRYTGSEITYPIADTLSYYIVSGHHRASAGLHYVTVTLSDTLHYMWTDKTCDPKIYEFLIDKYKVELPVAVKDSFTYDGVAKLFKIVANENYVVENLHASAVDTGIYSRKVSLVDTINYLWADGTIEDKFVTFYILKGKIPSITIPTNLVYTGKPINLLDTSAAYTISNNQVIEAGIYSVTVTPNPGYTWANDTTKTGKTGIEFTVRVWPQMVQIPAQNSTVYLYNGKTQTYDIPMTKDSLFSVDGNVQSEVGSYNVTVSLKDQKNYWWSDSTTTDKLYTFTISNSEFYVDPIKHTSDFVYEATPGNIAIFDLNILGNAYYYWVTCDSCPDLNVDTTKIIGPMKTLDLLIPDTIKPGIYTIEVGFMSGTLKKTQEVTFRINYPATDIYVVWNDVLTVDNKDGLFHTYQWYKDGVEIPGATKQYYQENGELDGSYMCLVNGELYVGPVYFHIQKPLWIKARGGNGVINVSVYGDIPAGTKVAVYSMNGLEVRVDEAQPSFIIEDGLNPDQYYILKLISDDPTVKISDQSVKVLVK